MACRTGEIRRLSPCSFIVYSDEAFVEDDPLADRLLEAVQLAAVV
jgi:hypothetical protein